MTQQFPISEDKKIQTLSDVLTSYIYQEDITFAIEGQELYAPEVAGHFGCLALLLLPAKENYESVYNQNFSSLELLQEHITKKHIDNSDIQKYKANEKMEIIEKKFPVDFISNEEAYFNVEPMIDETKNFPFVVLVHFVHHALEEYINAYKKKPEFEPGMPIALDALYEKWKHQILSDIIVIKPPRNSGPSLDGKSSM